MSSYKPSDYWEKHLAERPGLLGTGHRRFTLAYNIQMYAVATTQLQRALSHAGIQIQGASILDVGSGFGYYVDKYLSWGAGLITGVDLTNLAIEQLRAKFPEQIFHRADISEEGWSIHGQFDLVSAISMIFHIVDEQRFQTALRNLCRRVAPGGHLLVVDSFQPQWLPTAPHARLRDLAAYRTVLTSEGFDVTGIYPMHFVMGRAFIPVLGPAVLNLEPATRLLTRIERWLLDSRLRPAWLNFMIARKNGLR